jgi:hypothetical protein
MNKQVRWEALGRETKERRKEGGRWRREREVKEAGKGEEHGGLRREEMTSRLLFPPTSAYSTH